MSQKEQKSVWGFDVLEQLQNRRLALISEMQKKQALLQTYQGYVEKLSNEIVSMSGNISEVDYMLSMEKEEDIPDVNTSSKNH